MTRGEDAPVASLAAIVLDQEAQRAAAREDRTRSRDAGTVPALECRAIDCSYGKVQVLFGVDLLVRPGEAVALLGSNGAGKSTLLRVISGLLTPDHGVVEMHGESVAGLTAEQRVGRGIVHLIGGAATFGSLTVADNLRAGGYRYARREAKDRVDRAFQLFPMLGERREERARELSGGQQHMLALALALMHDPEVLLIDELSLGLAPTMVQQVVDVVRVLKARQQTMILAEQSLDVALEIADHAVFMEKGQIRFVGTTRELMTRDDLLGAVFLGA
jgi:ABC-type branched-subunit amino acid transport system ATPase component